MEMWHFKEDNEDEEEFDSEERLDLIEEEEAVPLENIIQDTPTPQTSQRFNKIEITPFLESEPVDNLEQGLEQTPTTEPPEGEKLESEQPMLYNAPQYSGSYDSKNYEDQGTAKDNQMDVSGGALTTRDTAFHAGAPEFQRNVNVAAWQQSHVTQMQSPEQKYQTRQPQRFKEKEDLPFQSETKPKGLF